MSTPHEKRVSPETESAYRNAELPATGYRRQAQLVPQFLPFSSATLWRMVKAGTFPAPVKLSERVTAWRCEDVHAWMRARSGVKA